MIYWFLLILGCQACTKSLITYVANIDSSYVGFFIILRSYVCKILDLYQVLTYVCRIYLFLIITIFCQYWIPTYVGYDNLFQTGILCSKKAVHLLQRRCRRIPQASLVSTLVPYPSWGTVFVCSLYFTLFSSTKKFIAGQIKNIVLPPPLPPHRRKYSSRVMKRLKNRCQKKLGQKKMRVWRLLCVRNSTFLN